jgi:hypothetical protein
MDALGGGELRELLASLDAAERDMMPGRHGPQLSCGNNSARGWEVVFSPRSEDALKKMWSRKWDGKIPTTGQLFPDLI